jgi:hypothetical protein
MLGNNNLCQESFSRSNSGYGLGLWLYNILGCRTTDWQMGRSSGTLDCIVPGCFFASLLSFGQFLSSTHFSRGPFENLVIYTLQMGLDSCPDVLTNIQIAAECIGVNLISILYMQEKLLRVRYTVVGC